MNSESWEYCREGRSGGKRESKDERSTMTDEKSNMTWYGSDSERLIATDK
jgi:hypothetical protein